MKIAWFIAGSMVGGSIAILFLSCFLIGKDWE